MGPTALYSRDLLTSSLRLFVKVIEQVRGDGFRPDTTRSGMITPVAGQQSMIPRTPVMGGGIEGFEERELPPLRDVKQEVIWPDTIDGVIDLDAEFEKDDLLEEGNKSSSADESSSDYSSDSDVEVQEEPIKPAQELPLSDMFVNTSSLVIHQRKNAGSFRCGRRITSSYCSVWEPHGLRCGNCFPE